VWRRWAEVGATLSEQQWSQPTRCDGWDIAALYAHVSMFPRALIEPPPAPDETSGDPVTAVDILRGFNAPGGVAHHLATQVAQAAVATARNLTPATLVAVYADGPRATTALRHREPTSLVAWPGSGGPTTWIEALRIVLMESVVHLLDVLDALGRAPQLPGAALDETTHLLAELADPVRLIDAATGRSADSPFPVLR
jgi:uncharacterized protein (TIGR03083 family)